MDVEKFFIVVTSGLCCYLNVQVTPSSPWLISYS